MYGLFDLFSRSSFSPKNNNPIILSPKGDKYNTVGGLTKVAWMELQKSGILVSRIPDISGRKSGHIFAYLAYKDFNTVDLLHSSTPNK